MASKKVDFIVKILPDVGIYVYVDNPELIEPEIVNIEGVSQTIIDKNLTIIVYTDPRYDIRDIAAEITELLKADVPAVFRD